MKYYYGRTDTIAEFTDPDTHGTIHHDFVRLLYRYTLNEPIRPYRGRLYRDYDPYRYIFASLVWIHDLGVTMGKYILVKCLSADYTG